MKSLSRLVFDSQQDYSLKVHVLAPTKMQDSSTFIFKYKVIEDLQEDGVDGIIFEDREIISNISTTRLRFKREEGK
jgi:hypothetical protein